jgi:hypothetical protein
VESCCDDPTCEICSPLPPLYEGMARNHRLNRRAMRGHGRGHGFHGYRDGGCSCCNGNWLDGEIIEGEIIDGDFCGGCSSCMSGDGMMMSGGCSSCGQTVMHESSMPYSSTMSGQTFESHGEPQPTLAHPQRSPSVPSGGPAPPPSGSSVPAEMAPMPMGQPMGQPMSETTSMRAPNYGAALFGTAQAEPMQYAPASTSQPVIQEQAVPMQEILQQPQAVPPAPPLASPAAHAQPMPMMMSPAMPTFPTEQSGAPQPSDFYSPKSNAAQPVSVQPHPIQLQSASIPATPPGKKPFRPFSEAAKPRKPPADSQGQPAQLQPQPSAQPMPQPQPQSQPQWEGSLQMQPMEQTKSGGGWLPTLPASK